MVVIHREWERKREREREVDGRFKLFSAISLKVYCLAKLERFKRLERMLDPSLHLDFTSGATLSLESHRGGARETHTFGPADHVIPAFLFSSFLLFSTSSVFQQPHGVFGFHPICTLGLLSRISLSLSLKCSGLRHATRILEFV